MYCERTTADEETQIARRIHSFGQNGLPYIPWCTYAVSSVLRGIGPFKNLTPTFLPGKLQDQLEDLHPGGR